MGKWKKIDWNDLDTCWDNRQNGQEFMLNKSSGKSRGRGKLMKKYMDAIEVMISIWSRWRYGWKSGGMKGKYTSSWPNLNGIRTKIKMNNANKRVRLNFYFKWQFGSSSFGNSLRWKGLCRLVPTLVYILTALILKCNTCFINVGSSVMSVSYP